jgi:predicted nucleic acid-binding protein
VTHVLLPDTHTGTLADRLLIATAIELGCPLVTYDEHILRFGKRRGRQHGFATSS